MSSQLRIRKRRSRTEPRKVRLAPRSRREILSLSRGVDRDYPRARCIHQLFEDQVHKTPDAIALLPSTIIPQREVVPMVDAPSEAGLARLASAVRSDVTLRRGHSPWTYEELNRQANQVAHHLLNLGAGPHDVIGLCLDRSPRLMVAILGILKAGCAYLPIDPTYPTKRLKWMLADAQVPLVVTDHRERPGLQHGSTRLIPIQ